MIKHSLHLDDIRAAQTCLGDLTARARARADLGAKRNGQIKNTTVATILTGGNTDLARVAPLTGDDNDT